MGYYTSYSLEVIEGDDLKTDYEEEIGKEFDYGNPFDDSCKWYEHERDMRSFSKKHPNTLFKLIGDGEENGDQWHEYYQNGKMQRCEAVVIFPEFDPTKLL